ncbi:hypothetical protein [Pantanalinema sp. GBBB05]|uniref:hypothetical protein n=1 Tax=Pantanalinema sp. GBBB05 TaxID=2604139 RepID=UPI001D2DC2A0|nr:hypothetical protein [Pantanalinema sp. GBBB05]
MQFLALTLLSGSLIALPAPSGNNHSLTEASPVKALQSTLTAPMQVGNEQNLHRGSGRREFFYQAETLIRPA